MKRAADAAPRFQERLKAQITRSTAVLLTAFLLLLGVLLITAGAGMIYIPAGFIVGGILLIAMAVIDGFDDSANDEGSDGQA